MFNNKSIKLIANYLIGIVLFLWIAISLYRQVKSQSHLNDAYNQIISNWNNEKIILLSFVFVLMMVNWTLEAVKWKILIQKIENINVLQSLKSVFAGISVSMLTPNRVGEYAGRILFLKNNNKLKGISANVIGSFALIIVASFFGVLGSLYFGFTKHFNWIIYSTFFIGLIVLFCMWFLYFHLEKITNWLSQISFFQKIIEYIEIVKAYDNKLLKKLILLSVIRYLVYTFQFVLLLKVFGVNIIFVDAVFTIFLIYWSMAILPSIAIAELGIRSGTSVFFMKYFTINTIGVISSSVVLWLINLIIPALIGSVLILSIKILKEKEN